MHLKTANKTTLTQNDFTDQADSAFFTDTNPKLSNNPEWLRKLWAVDYTALHVVFHKIHTMELKCPTY